MVILGPKNFKRPGQARYDVIIGKNFGGKLFSQNPTPTDPKVF